jgi:cob(I)alamin adenosyltransferase
MPRELLKKSSLIPNVFQKLKFQHSRRAKFEPGETDIEADPVKHRVDADGFKFRDAGAAENPFLKHVRYICLSFLSAASSFAEEKMGEAVSEIPIPAAREKSISIVKNLAGRLQELSRQVESLHEQIARLGQQDFTALADTLQKQLKDLEERVDSREISHFVVQLEGQINEMQKQIFSLHEKSDQTQIHETLSRLNAELSSLRSQLATLEERQTKSNVEQVLGNVVLHLKAAEDQISALEHKMQDTTTKETIETLSTQIDELQNEMKVVTQQLQETPTSNSVKQLAVQVNNVQNELCDVKEDLEVPADSKVVLDSASPRGRLGVFLTGEWLYWKFYEGGTDYATTYSSSFLEDAHGKQFHFNWTSGFRVGLGYVFERDAWDLYFSYTQIQNNANSSTDGTLFPLLLYQDIGSTDAPITADSAHIHWKAMFRNLDADLGREYFVGKWLSFHPAFGLKGAWIDQNIKVRYNNSTDDEEFKTKFKNDFSGVGPKLGVNSNWFLGKGFSFYAGVTGALLWGDFSLKQTQERTDDTVEVDLKSHFDRIVPTAQIRTGLLFDWFFNRDRCHIGINAGWEFQYWWNQNQIERFTDDRLPIYIRSSDELSMQGFTLGLRFDF